MRFVSLCTAILTAGLFLGVTANADTPSYSYTEIAASGGDGEGDIDGFGSADTDMDGYEIEGLLGFADRFFGYLQFTDLEGDDLGFDIDYDTKEIGVGMVFESGDNGAFDLMTSWRRDELSALGLSNDLKGPGISVGYRNNLTDLFELFARLGVYGGDYDESTQLDAGVSLNLSEVFAISLAYEYFEYDEGDVELEVDQIQLGFRFNF